MRNFICHGTTRDELRGLWMFCQCLWNVNDEDGDEDEDEEERSLRN